MTSSTIDNGLNPSDPTVLLALFITWCITKLVPADQIGAAVILYPFVHQALRLQRR